MFQITKQLLVPTCGRWKITELKVGSEKALFKLKNVLELDSYYMIQYNS